MQASYSPRGLARYSVELWHEGLKKHRVIRSDARAVLQQKVRLQVEEWDARWEIEDAREREKTKRDTSRLRIEERKGLALERTAEAQSALEELGGILKRTLSVDDTLDWESLKDKAAFAEPKPRPVKPNPAPIMPPLPQEPQLTDTQYKPRFGLLDRFSRARRERLFAGAMATFEADHAKWAMTIEQMEQLHRGNLDAHARECEMRAQEHAKRLAEWSARKAEHEAAQQLVNAAVDEKRKKYEAAEPEAIKEYCDLVLADSAYPEYFPREWDLDYDVASKTVIVDYRLPAPEDLPTLKAVKYVASRDELEEQHLSEAQVAKIYDEVLYQVALRTVHELFEADQIGALAAVAFNGVVTAVNKATGKPVTACVMSLRCGREDFVAIDLGNVEPRACFKSLRGVGAAKLHGLSAVAAIMPLQREDARFVQAYAVAEGLEAGMNLAAMDWEDFEHLIRELFEKEFKSTGGEVKVTRASRDGGVDAVAFDPDPIRGGKIVIQAKRYTSTVGVGAVRDLYGTVLNEGATKGILVTTADYAAESYAFATGKPLVLLNGSNLLHLLEKHGHTARIDLKEARKALGIGE